MIWGNGAIFKDITGDTDSSDAPMRDLNYEEMKIGPPAPAIAFSRAIISRHGRVEGAAIDYNGHG